MEPAYSSTYADSEGRSIRYFAVAVAMPWTKTLLDRLQHLINDHMKGIETSTAC